MTLMTLMTRFSVLLLLVLICNEVVHADGPADNAAAQVRPIPPPGIEIDKATLAELLDESQRVREAASQLNLDAQSQALIEVIPRAVEMTVEQNMFYNDKEPDQARKLLEIARGRVQAASAGKLGAELLGLNAQAPADKPQLVIGGYRSRIDGSYQPYGLVVPAGWKADSQQPLRLDVWLHGRGEKSSEVAFLFQRLNQVGEFSPPQTLVLHPYGRYCNAFKFAGEIDVLEAIESVKRLFPVDEERIAMRGFSMGGAGCWQLAVHYPQLWAAANPGAGFSETLEFLRVFQKENFKPTDYQRKLLHWYDCPDWTNNLRHVPTVAYSGEIDNQKQAADVMAAAYKLRGMHLPHIIGANTAHKILAESKPLIQQQLDAALDKGRTQYPKTIDLTTYMLRYHELGWLSIEGLDQHWEEAVVHAELDEQSIAIQTRNISRLKLHFPATEQLVDTNKVLQLRVDAQPLLVAPTATKGDWTLWLLKNARGTWRVSNSSEIAPGDLAKRPGLTGPIDDAFMDSFLFVPPTDINSAEPDSAGSNSVESNWYVKEYKHATQEWRRHFRGDVIVRGETELTAEEIASHHLILFGTPATNPLIAKVLPKLPIEWTDKVLKVAGVEYDVTQHAPILIYPNPLNPERYIVLNSGFTFREFAYLNNARQIAMLPDWAVVNVTAGANFVDPGNVVAAGFFDESWK